MKNAAKALKEFVARAHQRNDMNEIDRGLLAVIVEDIERRLDAVEREADPHRRAGMLD